MAGETLKKNLSTVNSEIIAMFLLMQKMRQDVGRINKNLHIYFSLAGIAIIKTHILDSRQGFAIISARINF